MIDPNRTNYKWVNNTGMPIGNQIAILSVAQRLLKDTIETLESIHAPGNEFSNVVILVLKDMLGEKKKFGYEPCLNNWMLGLEGQRDNEFEREPVLCYVSGRCAYFTTISLESQWGDDWNDAPYEHNAGDPYQYYVGVVRRGPVPPRPYKIIKVMFESDLETPSERGTVTSVEEINNFKFPWLMSPDGKLAIYAGYTLSQFKKMVKDSGGSVYTEETGKSPSETERTLLTDDDGFSEIIELSLIDRSTGDMALVDVKWTPGVDKRGQSLVTTHKLEVPARIAEKYRISYEDWCVSFQSWFEAHFPGSVHRDLLTVVQV